MVRASMFGGFDPSEQKHEFFQRRRGLSFVLAILVYAGLFFVMTNVQLEKPEEKEEEIPVELAPQPEEEEPEEELEMEEEEEEPEPEPEPEEPPPPAPGPPPKKDQPVSDEPPPEIETPTELDAEGLDESSEAKDGQNTGGGGSGTGKPGGTGTEEPKEPPPEEPKEEVKKKPPARDPKKAQKRRRDDKAAVAASGNPIPTYPPPLKKRGIGGSVKVALTITPTSGGGAKLTKVAIKKIKLTNCPKEVEDKAKAALKKAVAQALAKWKYTAPCKMANGKPFVCVENKVFPFRLK